MQQTNSVKGIAMLLLCAFIWGTAFVAQSVGADLLGPFSFNGIRSFLGAFFLVPCIAVIDKLSGKPLTFWGTDNNHKRGDLITGGICCGVLLTVASTLQQAGIAYTSAGKAGFITALYIVIIPILGLLVKKRVTLMQWAAVGVAAVGMYFICINEGFSINKGDLIILPGAHVRYSVFCLRLLKPARHRLGGTANPCRYHRRVAAFGTRRHYELRHCLHPANRRAKIRQRHPRFHSVKSGIRLLRPCRLGFARRNSHLT